MQGQDIKVIDLGYLKNWLYDSDAAAVLEIIKSIL